MFNNSFIKMGQYRRIAHMMFNGAMIRDLEHETEYVAKLRKVTEINLTNSCKNYVMIGDTYQRSFKHLTRSAAGLGFDVAVIWFEGSWPMGHDFEDALLEQVDGPWANTKWLAAGHIINRASNNDAPKFHSQCVVLNLKEFASLGDIQVKRRWGGQFPGFIASQENIHDDYTPMELVPTGGIDKSNLNISTNNLDSLIPIGLQAGMTIHNLPQSVRDEKHCCYPEDDVEETKKWLMDPNWDQKSVDDLSQFSQTINEDKQELYGYKCMSTHVMYITNTENVPGDETYNCTVMTAPCSGLHQFKHMVNARKTLERVIWTDFSEAGIWWTKKVLAEWDGINFNAFYQKNKQELEDKWVAYHANNYSPSLANKFEASFESQEKWLEHWDWIRGLDHTFMKVNLVKDYHKVVEAIGENETVFMQISNIWQYEINYINTPHFQANAAFIMMVNEVLMRNKDLFLTGDSPSGVYYSYQNMKDLVSLI